ncbi:dihydropteroate synthase [Bryocella elongata]|uniref:dihydropteroate synthase n=1 Tax=Bryocella elongata TaxID=863522 RepID=A0A1H6BLE3_9BACT|nr:dihydropteroate synthase [Bryocella elongata]SEG61510.1 dihydropteroate synthase [Bryocella elongata]
MSNLTLSTARPLFEWRLRTRSLLVGDRTLLMAIVNLTPDSFSGDGLPGSGNGAGAKLAAATALAALDAGADLLDLGAESTRPGAHPVSTAEEQRRLLPVLEAVLKVRPDAIISVDTYHAATARAALAAGAEVINDVSGLTWDDEMAEVVSTTGAGLILMHTRGRPGDWRSQPPLPASEVLPLVFAGLMERMALAEAMGVEPRRMMVDPGFGFGKRGAENFTLLAGLGRLHELGRPLLLGLSRKGFLGDAVREVLPRGEELSLADARRTATTAGHVAAVLAGTHILRVHEVQPAREACAVADALLMAGQTLMFEEE